MVINIISPHASTYLGGMEIVTLQMARHLAKLGVSVRFFTRQTNSPTDVYTMLQSEHQENLKIIEVPLPDSSPIADGTWPTFYSLSTVFGTAAKAVYELHSGADFFVTHLSVDSLFVPKDAKVILHLHGSPLSTDPLMEAAVALPVATLAHSESIKDWWSNEFPHLHPIVFQNGIDTTYFTGDVFGSRPIDILYVGRFMEHKGIDDILNAVHENQRVVIAGNGLYLPALKKIVEDRGLTESVTFYDTPSTETIQQLYQQTKVFACPSKGREGLLTTLLEAGASGCAVVTTSGSGMTDLITHDKNGLVIAPSDAQALQASFDELLASTQRRQALAISLQNEIRNQWSWEAKSTQLKDVYDAVL